MKGWLSEIGLSGLGGTILKLGTADMGVGGADIMARPEKGSTGVRGIAGKPRDTMLTVLSAMRLLCRQSMLLVSELLCELQPAILGGSRIDKVDLACGRDSPESTSENAKATRGASERRSDASSAGEG